jgi:hypothetical protein
MLLHLRRLLSNTVTFCTLKEIQGQQQRRHARNLIKRVLQLDQ